MTKILMALSLLLGSLVAFGQVPVATIPAFSFSRVDNSTFTREKLANPKPDFFVFFDTECDHCRHAIQYLDQHHNKLGNAAVYLLTLENKDRARTFLSKFGSNLLSKSNVTLLRDTHSEFITKFKPRKYPSLFLFSASQRLLLYNDDPVSLPKFLQQIAATERR
jgi:hypothetical protein